MSLTSEDIQRVFLLLKDALQQEDAIRKPAEASLAACENRPGFSSCLVEIIGASSLHEQASVRWLAAVYFKNSINRYWRAKRDASHGISNEEKPHLRSKVLELIRDENSQVATQLAVSISKIARLDYPKDWPDLFPTLLQKLQSSDVLQTQRVYLTLNQVLKELSTKRLGADQKSFAQITSQLFEFTWRHWYSDTEKIIPAFTTILQTGADNAAPLSAESQQAFGLTCDRWLLCTRTLRRMLIFGYASDFKSVQEVPAVQQVIPSFLQAVQSLLHFRAAAKQQQASSLPFLEKACLKLMKTMNDVQLTHPYSFSSESVMLPALDFCYSQVMEGQAGVETAFEPFLIQCLILLQNVLKSVAYKQLKTGGVVGETPTLQQTKARLSAQGQSILESFYDQKKVVLLTGILVERYFMLTQHDLAEWDSSPEEFHHEQDQAQWQDKLRPCAEAFFMILFEHCKEILSPVVIDMLKQASSACPPPSSPDAPVAISPALLLKDACYNAIGVANYDLYDYVDFKSWYQGVLALEMSNRHPNGRILRRRTAWLAGHWVSKIKGDLRQPIYSSLVALLGDGDLAVQLAACQALRTLIDDVNFFEEEFVPFVDPCLRLLLHTMQSVTELDSQLQLIGLVTLIIDRLGDKVVPCVDKLMTFLPGVWANSDGQSLLKIQVMLALQRLLIALGSHSPVCYPLLFPILHYSTDINQPDELNMLEDGLQLWSAALRNAPAMVPPLMHLFTHLGPIMERNFDHLLVAMRIIESYILVGGAEFLHHHGQSVVTILNGVVGSVNEKGLMVTLGVIDTVMQCFPTEAPPVLEHLFQKLLVMVVAGDDSDLVKGTAAIVLARLMLQNSSFFAQFISSPATAALLQHKCSAAGGTPPLFLYVDEWMDKMDSVSSVAKRKLSALALCVLLTMREAQVLERLEAIIRFDYWAANATEDGSGPEASESEYLRRRQVFSADPVNSLRVGPLLKEKLQVCAAIHGETLFNAAMGRVHPSVLEQLRLAVQ